MESPVCVSQFFVHKMGLRSARSNPELRNALRDDTPHFLQRILKGVALSTEIDMTGVLSDKLHTFLTEFQCNLKVSCRDDFKKCFPAPARPTTASPEPIVETVVADACCSALVEVLPHCFFGHSVNRRLFLRQVRDVVGSAHGQHLLLARPLSRWRLDYLTWCGDVDADVKKLLLYCLLLWIYKNILAAMILLNFYVTTTKCTDDERKLFYFSKSQWQSYHDRNINDMIESGVILRHELSCLGASVRRRYSAMERLKLKQLIINIPKLYIVMKSDDKFRPIVRYTSKNQIKKKLKSRNKLLKALMKSIQPSQNSFESEYMSLFKKWVEMKRPKLYFVKADLTDAFGSIDRGLLVTILTECHKKYQERENNLKVKKDMAIEYKSLISDLRGSLLLRCGSTVYEWCRGLLQGLHSSPALSDIYYSYLDGKHLCEVLSNRGDGVRLFRRVVDDYLYITDCLENATEFLINLSKYNNLNYSKTVTNFVHQNIQVSHHITFLGYVYNTATLEVGRSHDAYCGRVCYKTAFTLAVADVAGFVERRISQSSLPVNPHIFNMYYNNEKSLWKYTFLTLCLSANKFCTILAILCDKDGMSQYLPIFKKQVSVRLCNAIVDNIARNTPKESQFYYCINHFRYLAYKALLICALNTKKCTTMVPDIKVMLAKTNCMSGKWRVHTSRLDRDGVLAQSANRDICRRPEIKKILQSYVTLPKDFECYKSRGIEQKVCQL